MSKIYSAYVNFTFPSDDGADAHLRDAVAESGKLTTVFRVEIDRATQQLTNVAVASNEELRVIDTLVKQPEVRSAAREQLNALLLLQQQQSSTAAIVSGGVNAKPTKRRGSSK